MKALIEKINALRQTHRAVILAHNYQRPEVQDIADFVGDSLELSRKAAATDAQIIVFCGVHFMAETAKILSPAKTVLLPDEQAGCPMANMITDEDLRQLKAKHPGALVVCYVNSSAAVKAECDYCCTSANAVTLVNSLPADQQIIFVPDKYLGDHVQEQTGRELILWPGYCPTHVRITEQDLQRARQQYPAAVIMAHPECPRPIRHGADVVLSTSGMCRYPAESPAREFVIATEEGIIHRLRQSFPDRKFYSVTDRALCPNMKKITLEKVVWALERLSPEITIPASVADRARQSLERMIK